MRITPLGINNIFLSTYFHFVCLAFLEIPTSLVSDLYESGRIVKIGVLTKLLGTILFALVVFYSEQQRVDLALLFLLLEALIDGVGNSLLSGSFQAAYVRKGKKTLNDFPLNLFVASLRYSLFLRLAFPLLAIILLFVINGQEIAYYSVISYVILLRIFVIVRTFYDFSESDKEERPYLSISSFYTDIRSFIKSNKNVLIMISYFSLQASVIASYVLPNMQSSLKKADIYDSLMAGATYLLVFHIIVLLITRFMAPLFEGKKVFFRSMYTVAALVGLNGSFMASQYFLDDHFVKFIAQTFIVLFIYILSFLGGRIWLDRLVLRGFRFQATLISLSEVFALGAFAVFGVLGFYFKTEVFLVITVSVNIILGFGILLYEEKSVAS